MRGVCRVTGKDGIKCIWMPEMMEILFWLMPANVSEQELQLRQTTIHTDPLKIFKSLQSSKVSE